MGNEEHAGWQDLTELCQGQEVMVEDMGYGGLGEASWWLFCLPNPCP